MRFVIPVLVASAALAACGGPAPGTTAPATPTSAVASDGRFQLDFTLPRPDWKSTDPITGSANLSITGGAPTTIWGSGELIAYSFNEVGGPYQIGPGWPLDCGPFPLDTAAPINVSLYRSGGFDPNGPDGQFLSSFFADPQIHLPAGTWNITAIAIFSEGECSITDHTIEATLRVTVTN